MDYSRMEIIRVSAYTHMRNFVTLYNDERFDVATDTPNLGATFFATKNSIQYMYILGITLEDQQKGVLEAVSF